VQFFEAHLNYGQEIAALSVAGKQKQRFVGGFLLLCSALLATIPLSRFSSFGTATNQSP